MSKQMLYPKNLTKVAFGQSGLIHLKTPGLEQVLCGSFKKYHYTYTITHSRGLRVMSPLYQVSCQKCAAAEKERRISSWLIFMEAEH